MTRVAHQLYAALFILLVTALGLVSLRSVEDFKEPAKASPINGEWAQVFEHHYNAEFPVKNLGTSFWAAVQYLLFHEGREGVEVGTDDWLYTSEEFQAYPGYEQKIHDKLQMITAVRDRLREHGTELQMVIVPAKARIYPEHLGSHSRSPEQQELYYQAFKYLSGAGVHTTQLLSPFEKAKDQDHRQVFLRTDTHWSPDGALIAADVLAKDLKSNFPDMDWGETKFETHAAETLTHYGDLMSFIPLDPYFSSIGPEPEKLVRYQTDKQDNGAEGLGDLFGDVEMPVVLVGTSYSANKLWNFVGAVEQKTGMEIPSFATEGEGPFVPMTRYLMSDDFRNNPPEVVIWEFPERYLPMNTNINESDKSG